MNRRLGLMVLCTLIACSDGSTKRGKTAEESPADTAEDSDADTDVDADTDADTDLDTGTDTDAQDCTMGVLGIPPITLGGTTAGAGNDSNASCSSGDSEDVALDFIAPARGRYRFDTTGSSFDTVLYVRESCDGTDLACNDDAADTTSSTSVDLAEGQQVIVIVDGFGEAGPFTLNIDAVPSVETDCTDGLDEDYDGKLDCIDPDCASLTECVPQCPDLVGGDMPTLLEGDTTGQPDSATGSCDWSFFGGAPDTEVSFTAPTAGRYVLALTENTDFDALLYVLDSCGGSELDCSNVYGGGGEWVLVDLATNQTVVAIVDGTDLGSGHFEILADRVPPSESDCADGLDEDFDGLKDCTDTECAGVGGCVAACPDLDAELGSPLAGTTIGQPDEFVGSCDWSVSPTADSSVSFSAPSDGRYLFSLTPNTTFDSVLYVLASCGGAELGCDDIGFGTGGELVTVDLIAGQEVVAIVDGYEGSSGDFELSIVPVAAGEIGLCADQIDNDVDGLPDCMDAECQQDAACVEYCDNQLDDDFDGHLDCLDAACASDLTCVETCPENALSGALPLQFLGSTAGAANDFQGSCAANYGASDTTFTFTAPSAGTYVFDTLGTNLDTLLYVLDGSCAGTELGCNDDTNGLTSEVAVTLAAGQTVVVVVDGYRDYVSGDYVLNVHQ